MGKDVRILVCTHKKWKMPQEDYYLPLHVGKAMTDKDFGYIGDDTGENISSKNKNFCELTGIYWGWKNLHVTYIGICHYRRYLDFQNCNPVDFLGNYDVVLPKLHVLKVRAIDQMMNLTTREDGLILLMSILKVSPEYKDDVLNYLFNSNKCSGFNMMFCRKEVFDGYCKWLFSVYSELEKWIRISDYTRLSRIFGYLSEYMPYLYFMHNKMRIKYTSIVSEPSTHQSFWIKSVLNNVEYHIKSSLKTFAFKLLYPNMNSFPVDFYESIIVGFKNDKIPHIDSDGSIITM